MRSTLKCTFFSLSILAATQLTHADQAANEIAKYREMVAEGNPAELNAAKGEALWKEPRGPKNVSLQGCDLGLGAGVVKHAYARLPRYFADSQQVQDLESRLLTCMETLQGFDRQTILNEKFLSGERQNIANLVAYIVSESQGDKVRIDRQSPAMKQMYALGKKMFYYRAGPMDFACATCHGAPDKRIRLQELGDLRTFKGAAAAWGSWPAYRISSGEFWTMQHRLYDCFRQQRFPEPIYVSPVTQALSVFLATNANGAKLMVPGIKR